MNVRRTVGVAAVLLGGIVAAVWGTALGQESTPGAAPYSGQPRQPRTPRAAPASGEPTYAIQQIRLADPQTEEVQKLKVEDRKLENEIKAALREYAAAEEDDKRSELRSKLSGALQQQFEIRQRMRDRDIAALEEQIKRLRELFEKREAAKDRIVEARLDQLIRAAEGLGWDANVGTAPGTTATFPGSPSRQNPFYFYTGQAR